MDEKLVIPKGLRDALFRSLHWGHPGRDAMLREAADIWWPGLYKEIVWLANVCPECGKSGKNIKPILRKKQFGKLEEPENVNDEVALDFAGPYAVSNKARKYILVSVDHKTGWPDAMFLREPNADKVIEFVTNYIALFGVPKAIRTDHGTVFTDKKFKSLCRKHGIRHILYPLRDDRGNGKVERMIRTLNERLRANKEVFLTKDHSGLSEILFALRVAKKADETSPFELQMGRKPNTFKSIVTDKTTRLDVDPDLKIESKDFLGKPGKDTRIIRKAVRGSKLENCTT